MSVNEPFSSTSDSFLISLTMVMDVEVEAMKLVRDVKEKTCEAVMDFEQKTLELVMESKQETSERAMAIDFLGRPLNYYFSSIPCIYGRPCDLSS